MLSGDIAQIVLSVAMIFLASIFAAVIKTRLTDENITFIERWIRYAVLAFEQIFNGEGMGFAKKRAVVEFIKRKGIKITTEELDVLIERTVYELNNK